MMNMNAQMIFCYGDSNTYGYDPRSYLGSRYPETIRWTGRLQQKAAMANQLYENPTTTSNADDPSTAGTKYRSLNSTFYRESLQNCPETKVFNLGVPGRQIPRFEYEMQQIIDMVKSQLPASDVAQSKDVLKHRQSIPYTSMQESVCASHRNQEVDHTANFHAAWLWIMLGTNDLLNSETITAEKVADRMKAFLDYLVRQECFQDGQLTIRLIAPPKMQPGTWVSTHALEESARLGDCMKAIVPAGVAFTDSGQWELPVCFDGVHLTEEGHRIFAEEMFKICTN